MTAKGMVHGLTAVPVGRLLPFFSSHISQMREETMLLCLLSTTDIGGTSQQRLSGSANVEHRQQKPERKGQQFAAQTPFCQSDAQ